MWGTVGAASILLTYTLDLRKKLELLDIVLKSRGFDESKTFKRIHIFHDLRNVFAHWPFEQDPEGGEGLWCDYIDKRGDITYSIPGTAKKDRVIKYVELDSYDAEMSEVCERLEGLPITPITEDDKVTIEEAINSSENVVRFPGNLRRKEETEE
jgi:hypothetical protein